MESKEDQISIKIAELSIRKFNDIGIPNLTGLLKNHKSNIEKSVALGDWDKVKREELNAMRVIKQLKHLLTDMDSLRRRMFADDIAKFDKLIDPGKSRALAEIQEYLDLQLKTPSSSRSFDDEFNPIEDPTDFQIVAAIETDFKMQEHLLKSREACMTEFQNLQREIEDIHEMFYTLNGHVREQGEQVDVVAENVEETQVNVIEGESQLRKALKYKKAMYPVCGALIGTCVGGPVGFIAGLKAGGLAALGCGILGFTGGTVLKKNEESRTSDIAEVVPDSTPQDKKTD